MVDDLRIDAHAHLLPASYRDELTRRSLIPSFGLPDASPDGLAAFMERYAIDAAVISLPPPGVYFGDVGLARELARTVNEAIAEQVRRSPSRLAGLAVLPLPDLEGAIAELDYALDVLGLDGVGLLSNVAGTYLGDPGWDPLFTELDRRSAYVFIHPTSPRDIPLKHPVWLYEFPFDTTRAVVELIYSGTLERHRNLRIQVAHLGGTAPFLAHRIASLADREPALAQLAPGGALHYLSRLYYDTGLSNHALAVDTVLHVAPISQIVFGSDWPYAAFPEGGDPAPGLAPQGAARALIDSVNIGALVPRLLSEASARLQSQVTP